MFHTTPPSSPIYKFAELSTHKKTALLVKCWEPVQPFEIRLPYQVGIPHRHLVQPLAIHHPERHDNTQDQISSPSLFLKSIILSSIRPSSQVLVNLEFTSSHTTMKSPRKRQTHWTFVKTETLGFFMDLYLRQRLDTLRKPVVPRADVVSFLGPCNALHCNAKINLQTRRPQPHSICHYYKLKKYRVARIRSTRFRRKRIGDMPDPHPCLLVVPFCLDRTPPPGPIEWPTDHKYFKGCHKKKIELAARLRLSDRKYMDSKKRMLFAKLYLRRNGLPMTKMDAQRVCRIDCKTAASLYTAFKSVGWLRRGLFDGPMNTKKIKLNFNNTIA